MDKSIPRPAALLLKFIGKIEAPQGYDTIYGNNQKRLKYRITKLTLNQLSKAQPLFTKYFGSSASGHYQIMRDTLDAKNTLADLVGQMKLSGTELFDPDMQDRMAFHLLKRRGYNSFMLGKIDVNTFALQLAKEWASFPVLAAVKGAHRTLRRGQSYYAGDGVNKALVKPETIEKLLASVRADKPPVTEAVKKIAVGAGCAAGGAGTVAVAVEPGIVTGGTEAVIDGTKGAESVLEQVTPITDTVSLLGYYGPYIAGAVVGLVVLAFIAAALYKWARKD